MGYANQENYPELEAEKIVPLGDRILVEWEQNTDEIKLGNLTLVRPDTHKRIHYTGNVIKVGPHVDEEIKPGDRIIFDQFSNFEKFFDPNRGRLALIEATKQGSCFAVIPPRVNIKNGEPDYDYSA